MKKVIEISELIDCLESERGVSEIYATAGAMFDEEKSELIVKLNAEARGEHFKPGDGPRHDWLPRPQVVKERVSLAEAMPLAKEIFHGWARRVRRSIPQLADEVIS